MMSGRIGMVTGRGDRPRLNAVFRAVGKAAAKDALIHNRADGVATQLTSGDLNGDGIDEAYWINLNDNRIYRYRYGEGESLLDVGGNGDWSKILLADLDGNGADELYGLQIGDFDHVWWYEAGMLGFATVPEPSAAVLLGLGALGLALVRRRRRSG